MIVVKAIVCVTGTLAVLRDEEGRKVWCFTASLNAHAVKVCRDEGTFSVRLTKNRILGLEGLLDKVEIYNQIYR